MYKFKGYHLFFFFFLLNSCEKSVVLNIDDFSSDETVNCLLTPDSSFLLQLSWSEKAGYDSAFPPINNANVSIIDEGTSIRLNFISQGKYGLDQKPSETNTYRLKVETKEGSVLTASTSVPVKPNAEVIALPDNREQDIIDETYNTSAYSITIKDHPDKKEFYWIAVQNNRYFYNDFQQEEIIYTDLKNSDDFNRNKSTYYPDMDYYHSFYIRIDDELWQGETIRFKIRFDGGFSQKDRICVISADANLDHYMKSALIQYDQKNLGDAPIFFIPVNVYSNIENGKGIFGSYSMSVFDFNYQ